MLIVDMHGIVGRAVARRDGTNREGQTTLSLPRQSLRSRTQRTEWSWSLRSTSVARDRVGWMFCFRLGPLISSQIGSASATASSWESEA